MNVLYPSETLKDSAEITKIISNNNIQNEANNPSDEFLQFLHFNLSFIVQLYLQKDTQYDPNFYLNAEYIFKSNCDGIKIIMSTNEQLLNIFFSFLQKESKKTTYLIRGRFCKLLGQVLLLSDIDYTSHLSKFIKLTVHFNDKSELRNCGGIIFLILLVSNIQYLPFFDLIYDIIKSHTYSALTFFEENFFTQILLNKLATTNQNSIVSSLYSSITFTDEETSQDDQKDKKWESIIEIKNIDQSDDDNNFSKVISNNVLKILMHLTCNLSRSSSLVIPLLKKETILTLLDASINEEFFHTYSSFQLITSLHKQSNQNSREAIEAINGRLPKICESIMNQKKSKITKDEISLITLFCSIINDIYGVAGESIPEPINYRMKKSVHLSDSLELFSLKKIKKTRSLSGSKSQDSYYIDEQMLDICEEEEEEEEGEWLYGGEFDTSGNGGSSVEDETEVPMNLTEFTRKKYSPIQVKIIDEIQKDEKNEVNKKIDDDEEVKKKNIPQIPNFAKATNSHHHRSRHSTSILTYKDLEVSHHSGSNSGRIYKKQSDNFAFKNVGIINVSKGFTASSGCGRLSIRLQPNNNSNGNFYQKVGWMSNENKKMPKTEDDKLVITPTSSSSSSSRLELPKLEIASIEVGEINKKQQIQQLHQQIQYNYSFSDSHIIHAPESEVSPVTKDPTTGENLSLMDFANQAPSNPQIDLIFHQRTKSCNSIDYANNVPINTKNISDYSLSNDPVEDENISLLDLANSANNIKQAKSSLPMYSGQYGAPPVNDLYPLLQSTPVFFNNSLSPRESSNSIQSYSSRTDLDNNNPMQALLSTPKKSNDYTSSFNSTNSASLTNSNSSDIDANSSITTISENEPDKIEQPNDEEKQKDVLHSFPSSKNQLKNLNIPNMTNTSFSVSSGMSNRSRHSLSTINPSFCNLCLIDENSNEQNNQSNFIPQYPNSARTTRPNFLPSTCFTIQEDPTEQPSLLENEEEEVGEEEDEESEAELPEESLSKQKEETDQIITEKVKIESPRKDEIKLNEDIETINEEMEIEVKSNSTNVDETPENVKSDSKNNSPNNSPSKAKKNKSHNIVNMSKKKSELIIQTTCFLIDQFFENPNNSFLHNIVIDLIKTFYRFTRLTPVIFNRSKILHRIIEIYKDQKTSNLPFSGHIHKFTEIAQKLNLRMSKYARLKKRSKPKEFLIFESDEWKNYVENVFDVEKEIMKNNYGGFYPELYLVMKDSKERVLRPDL